LIFWYSRKIISERENSLIFLNIILIFTIKKDLDYLIAHLLDEIIARLKILDVFPINSAILFMFSDKK